MSNEKFLEFNGKRITILLNDGTWLIALRPILDALNVDTDWHLRNVKNDKILAQPLCECTGVAADGKMRKMLCLPEKYIYGWLFTINSESEELHKFKVACYDVLYNHFHGTITGRMTALSQKQDNEMKIKQLEKALQENETYKQLQELKEKQKDIKNVLQVLDTDLVNKQLSISFN